MFIKEIDICFGSQAHAKCFGGVAKWVDVVGLF